MVIPEMKITQNADVFGPDLANFDLKAEIELWRRLESGLMSIPSRQTWLSNDFAKFKSPDGISAAGIFQ